MPIDINTLTPYRSLIVTKVRTGASVAGLVDRVVSDISATLQLGQPNFGQEVNRKKASTIQGMSVGLIHYEERIQPPWTTDPAIINTHQQLALVCRRGQFLAILLTDPKRRNTIRRCFDQPKGAGLGVLQPISVGILQAAFVQGKTRTLWLSGIHRRTTVKPDSKVLSGLNLRDALDGLADGTYYFSAVRSDSPIAGLTSVVGVSPDQSRVWAGPSATWPDCINAIHAVLGHVSQTTQPVNAPLPVLAIPSQDSKPVETAYDVGLIPPHSIAVGEEGFDAWAELEAWSEKVEFRIKKTAGPNIETEVRRAGELLGTLDFTVDVTKRDRVVWTLGGAAANKKTEDDYNNLVKLCRDEKGWVKIWYSSGHTLCSRSLYTQRHREVQFQGWEWVNLAGYDVSKEKPSQLTLAVLGTENSLFCWTKNIWPNIGAVVNHPGEWLACDDGGHEIADFIHLDTTSTPALLTLVHAKGTTNSKANRQVSLPHFETVVGQAVKNLRFLDNEILEKGLTAGLQHKISALAWHNRASSTRNAFLTALSSVGTNYRRQVLILHPNLTQTEWNTHWNSKSSTRKLRLRQVNTLLLGAEADCRALGAELRVITSS